VCYLFYLLGTILGFASAGSQIGNVITLPMGGFLCGLFDNSGWVLIFYVIGKIIFIGIYDTGFENKVNFKKRNNRNFVVYHMAPIGC
jgi:MFS family permease